MGRLTLPVIGLLLSWATSASAQSEDLYFLLSNETDIAVVGFYVSQAESGEWGENLMDGGYLPSGNEIEVVIEDGLSTCLYDIRTEFEDGDIFEDYDLDLCALGGYTFQ